MQHPLPLVHRTRAVRGQQGQNWYERHQPYLQVCPRGLHALGPVTSQPSPCQGHRQPTWHFNMNRDNFPPSIQCSRPIMDKLLETHQL
jgi:hypothetical protein